MRTYIEADHAPSANLLPENSFWKDHDSEADGGHPNALVLRRTQMNDSEISDHIWDMLKEYDLEPWKDENYNATIEKYGLVDFARASHLAPRLWFEPPESSDDGAADPPEPDADEDVPHMGHPFCMKCEMLLGAPRPALNLPADYSDPRCRYCGFLNPHGPDGRLMTDPNVDLMELGPSELLMQTHEQDLDEHFARVSQAESTAHLVDLRSKTTQKCDQCGHDQAYYWTAQVRGMDEGQTAFFECMQCRYTWSVKG